VSAGAVRLVGVEDRAAPILRPLEAHKREFGAFRSHETPHPRGNIPPPGSAGRATRGFDVFDLK
jgi:hypothetical protein